MDKSRKRMRHLASLVSGSDGEHKVGEGLVTPL